MIHVYISDLFFLVHSSFPWFFWCYSSLLSFFFFFLVCCFLLLFLNCFSTIRAAPSARKHHTQGTLTQRGHHPTSVSHHQVHTRLHLLGLPPKCLVLMGDILSMLTCKTQQSPVAGLQSSPWKTYRAWADDILEVSIRRDIVMDTRLVDSDVCISLS